MAKPRRPSLPKPPKLTKPCVSISQLDDRERHGKSVVHVLVCAIVVTDSTSEIDHEEKEWRGHGGGTDRVASEPQKEDIAVEEGALLGKDG